MALWDKSQDKWAWDEVISGGVYYNKAGGFESSPIFMSFEP
jgi:hypothetical protein